MFSLMPSGVRKTARDIPPPRRLLRLVKNLENVEDPVSTACGSGWFNVAIRYAVEEHAYGEAAIANRKSKIKNIWRIVPESRPASSAWKAARSNRRISNAETPRTH